MHTTALMMLALAGAAQAQSDGNPHQWDRQRRCDHIDYSPPCGPCEGIGGVPYGDKNEQIHMTTCKVTATGEPSTLSPPAVKPVWGASFTAPRTHEILIGPKNDPFCFNAFPSNSSAGKLCYREDVGTQVYDFNPEDNTRGIFIDTTLTSPPFGKIRSQITHQGPNMWIVNQLPLGIKQCVCVEVHQASDPTTPAMYPVQYNWTQQMFFIAREDIGVEYINADGTLDVQTLDHWAFGPHHVWSKPGTGEIIRMYQPYNGLQVFPTGNFNHTVDKHVFDVIPPPLCKKGGALTRIGCADNGFPAPKDVKAKTKRNHLSDEAGASDAEKARAGRLPSKAFKGDSFADMSAKLNQWLGLHPAFKKGAVTKTCGEMTAEELQQLQAALYLARDADLDMIYQENYDNRRLRASIEDLVARWEELNAEVAAAGDKRLAAVQRDGHCHEAVMWWVHHVSEDMKMVLAGSGIVLPMLSAASHGATCVAALEDASLPGDATAKKVCKVYQEQVTCQSCHSNVVPPAHGFLLQ